MLIRPTIGEYAEYFEPYIQLVPEGEVVSLLQAQPELAVRQLGHCTEEQGDFRYAEGKWSLKEVLGHITDTERVMSYRLLRIARGDTTPLPSFEESLFVSNAHFGRFTISALLGDFATVRQSTLALVRQLEDDAWLRIGNASDKNVSARALAYIMAGHANHHFNIIRERYLQV